MTQMPPEAPWVTDMRAHFHRHGFYRREDLERLLGKPGDSVQVAVNGAVVYHAASVDTRPKGGDATEIAAPFTSGAVPEGQTPKDRA